MLGPLMKSAAPLAINIFLSLDLETATSAADEEIENINGKISKLILLTQWWDIPYFL